MRFIAALLSLFLAACSSPPRRTDKSLRDLTPEESGAIQTNETEVLDALARIREAQSFEEQQKAETLVLENSVPRGKETPEVIAAQARYKMSVSQTKFRRAEMAVAIARLDLRKAEIAATRGEKIKVKDYVSYLAAREKDLSNAKARYENDTAAWKAVEVQP